MNLFVNWTLIFVFILIAIDFSFCKGINELIFPIILKIFKRFIVIIEVPVLLPLPSQSAVTEKSFFRLFCQISTGNRPLFFQWLKNGQTLANSPENDYKIENNDDFSLLKVLTEVILEIIRVLLGMNLELMFSRHYSLSKV